MVIDLEHESVLTLKEAAKALPALRGRKIHLSTLYRWIERGVDGVRLEALRLGRTLVTSREALQRFAERRGTGATSSRRRRDAGSDRTERELDRRGL